LGEKDGTTSKGQRCKLQLFLASGGAVERAERSGKSLRLKPRVVSNCCDRFGIKTMQSPEEMRRAMKRVKRIGETDYGERSLDGTK